MIALVLFSAALLGLTGAWLLCWSGTKIVLNICWTPVFNVFTYPVGQCLCLVRERKRIQSKHLHLNSMLVWNDVKVAPSFSFYFEFILLAADCVYKNSFYWLRIAFIRKDILVQLSNYMILLLILFLFNLKILPENLCNGYSFLVCL